MRRRQPQHALRAGADAALVARHVDAVSATSVQATVPTGARTGRITVTTPLGTAWSVANLTVTT